MCTPDFTGSLFKQKISKPQMNYEPEIEAYNNLREADQNQAAALGRRQRVLDKMQGDGNFQSRNWQVDTAVGSGKTLLGQ